MILPVEQGELNGGKTSLQLHWVGPLDIIYLQNSVFSIEPTKNKLFAEGVLPATKTVSS